MTTLVEEQHENNGKLPGGVTGKGFRPGRSGNPGGRPKDQPSLAALRRRRLADLCSDSMWTASEATRLGLDPGSATVADLLVEAELWAATHERDPRAIRGLLDRVEGRPAHTLRLDDGGSSLMQTIRQAERQAAEHGRLMNLNEYLPDSLRPADPA